MYYIKGIKVKSERLSEYGGGGGYPRGLNAFEFLNFPNHPINSNDINDLDP